VARASIPAGPEELTPEWLGAVLRASGALQRAEVVSVELEVLDGGLVAELVRVRLDLDRDEPGAPSALIAKLPSRRPARRALGEASGGYERECRFYQEVAREAPIPTPRLYHAACDPYPGQALVAPVKQLLERLPGRWIRIPLEVVLRVARAPIRRWVLLLEEVPERARAPARGCSAPTAERALRPLAALHAHFWQSPRLAELEWLKPLDETPRLLQALFQRAWPRFRASNPGRVPAAELHAIGAWLEAHGATLLGALAAPPVTLIHGDYHLDNLVFAHGELGTALDWQAVARARGVFDAAYLICADLDADLGVEVERGLVRGYHLALQERGVAGYGFEACWRDYELAKLLILHRLVVAFDAMELSHEREVARVMRWYARAVARVRGVDLEAAARELAARTAAGG
jgi:aminoglycoside phosphotransferase (APT) family kinase protein